MKETVTINGKVVGIELKRDFGTVWLTIEVPKGEQLPEYYSNVMVTDFPQKAAELILKARKGDAQ